MKSDCVLLGGFFILVGTFVAFMAVATKDPLSCVVGGGLGGIFILGGFVLLIEGFLKGGLDE
ncbi:MAG: hypothetical protein M0R06_14195 [Sphaerochaeta sp.]|jgi:hypothetical protein|nr:hypothetical protein [Sphaerochaeta sp.]MDD2730587.1 hypothetical protein [Candidatus Portnoybacteria bacterium]